jgi:hypothetical protein
MAARVIHFGCDECYRIPVLKSAGYVVYEPQTLDELSIDLLQNGPVDAVIISEDDRKITERAMVVAREHSTAPLVLFRRSSADLNEILCDRVFSPGVRPEEWLPVTAELIAQCRQAREHSAGLREQSQQLRFDAKSVREQSSWQRARGQKLKRNAS